MGRCIYLFSSCMRMKVVENIDPNHADVQRHNVEVKLQGSYL